MAFEHSSVLLYETVSALKLKPGMTVADGTLGGGGHALEILKRITPGGRLIGIDKDEYALCAAKKKLSAYKENTVYVHGDFKDIKALLLGLDIEGLDGAVLDIGVSSFQLDQCDRGFSYKQDSRLDMRMDTRQRTCAADIIADYTQRDLERILRDYGEERWAARIAAFIVRERGIRPIDTTGRLVEVVKMAVPSGARGGRHPARKTFQALRIEVNGELEALKTALPEFAGALKNGARLAVITFHSLEDRIVKQEFTRMAAPCVCPPSFPVCVCGKIPLGSVVTKKPILPSRTEVERNNRARSAKLRVFMVTGKGDTNAVRSNKI